MLIKELGAFLYCIAGKVHPTSYSFIVYCYRPVRKDVKNAFHFSTPLSSTLTICRPLLSSLRHAYHRPHVLTMVSLAGLCPLLIHILGSGFPGIFCLLLLIHAFQFWWLSFFFSLNFPHEFVARIVSLSIVCSNLISPAFLVHWSMTIKQKG